MILSVSAVVLFGILLFILLRNGALRAGGAIAAALFGFFLASTGIAPAIHGALDGITTVLAAIGG
ncbi:hypothetical protein [Streptomyces sp. URMC 125]|uniref:hypothetical protein n=1 Tax=Streptomyces sp. URMC 125 TaxID=3423419 RepID=UPI003F1B6891